MVGQKPPVTFYDSPYMPGLVSGAGGTTKSHIDGTLPLQI